MAAAPTQFIWLYFQDAARGDELRYSMRSVCQHFTGTPHLILVGDRPEWYCGQHIHVPRIAAPHLARFHAVLDSSYKLQQVLRHPDIADSFVIMMDDHYFLRDFSLSDIQVPRYSPGWIPKKRYWWDESTTLTMQTLERRGLSTYLYETHLMHFFEKTKLQQIFDTFNPTTVPVLRNTLYGNVFRARPKDCRPFVASPQTPQTVKQLNDIAKRSTVLNHASGAWDATLEEWLQNRLQSAAPVEDSAQILPTAQVSAKVVTAVSLLQPT